MPQSLHSYWDRLVSDSNWLSVSDRAPHACRCLKRQIPRNVCEIIRRAVEKPCSSSVTHFVIVKGNKRIKKWGREGYEDIHWQMGEVLSASEASKSQHLHCWGWQSDLTVLCLRFWTVSYWLTSVLSACRKLSYNPQRPAYSVSPSFMPSFLFSHASSVAPWKAVWVCWTVFFFFFLFFFFCLVLGEMFQQLLDGLPWNLVQIFRSWLDPDFLLRKFLLFNLYIKCNKNEPTFNHT